MRYFIFYYNWITKGSSGDGNIFYWSADMPHNDRIRTDAAESIAENLKGARELPLMTDIVITGFNEFKSREDFEGFSGYKIESGSRS